MLTIPTIDWVAKVGPNRSKLASFSIAKYGAQTGTDWQWFPDAGNGVRTNGQFVTGNDPNDANVPSTSLFQQAWVQHLVNRWGTNANGGSALLHSRQRAEHLAFDASRRPARRRRRWTRSATRQSTSRRRSRPSTRPRWSSDPRNGAGAATSTAATTSSTAATHGWSSLPIARITAAPTICRGSSISCGSDSTHDRPAPARCLHRSLLSAGRRVQRRRVDRDAAAAQPLDALAVGSGLRRRDLDQRPRFSWCRA